MIDSVSQSSGAASDLKKGRRQNRPDAQTDRLPPHSEDMERGVLGCILLRPEDCLDPAAERLPDPQAFYDLRHQEIYGELLALRAARLPIDLLTLQQRLKDRGLLEQIGGIPYLNQLQDGVPSAANLSYYLEIVAEKHWLRRALALCAEITGRIYDFAGDVEALRDQIAQDLFMLCEDRAQSTDQPMSAVLAAVHEQFIKSARRGVKRKVGPMTGFNFVDNVVPGFGRGEFVVIPARPSTGKSAWAMQVAEYQVLREKEPAALFTLEMTAANLGFRAVCQRGGVDMVQFLNGFFQTSDMEKLAGASQDLSVETLRVDEAPGLCIEDLEIRARRLVARHGVRVLWIDYLQLLSVRQRQRQWNTNDEVAHISKRLKRLALELKITVVALSQMNREIEKEIGRRPRLSDLRDSGQIEQDADIIAALWRPDLSTNKMKAAIADILPRMDMVPQNWRHEREWKNHLEIVKLTILKQRNGPSNKDATLVFIKPWTRFVDAYRPGADTRPGAGEPAPAAQRELGEESDE